MVVIAATVAMAMGFGGLGLITVFMGPMEADLGWSRSDTSLGYALSTAGMALGGLFWGRLSDRADVRLLLAVGGAGMVGSLLTMPMLHSLPVFYVANAMYGGFGFSVLYSPLLSTSGEWFPERRGLVMGLVTAGGALGQGLLPFFASFLINAFGWRWAFVGTAGTVLSALGLALPALRWPQRNEGTSPQLHHCSRGGAGRNYIGVRARACCLPLLHVHGGPGGTYGQLHRCHLRFAQRWR